VSFDVYDTHTGEKISTLRENSVIKGMRITDQKKIIAQSALF
jgi:hypothetical protein